MVKYCINKYPMGSFPKQQTPGRYMDGLLYDNLKILAKTIVNDMTFLGFVFSSTLEVGTGKSVFTQQCAEAITEMVNQFHGKNLEFTANNLVFKPQDLIDRSFKVPQYSNIILDEWEDAHYWSSLGMSLRKFFRKCRQLNLFIWCIIPNFFECPMSYAISRSVCAIDVHFEGEFERGFFKFYNFPTKKDLYIKGKKTHNYDVVRPNFIGRFTDGYAIPEKEYREAKRKDLEDFDEEDSKKTNPTEIKAKIYQEIVERNTDLTNIQLMKLLGLSKTTFYKHMKSETKEKEPEVAVVVPEFAQS